MRKWLSCAASLEPNLARSAQQLPRNISLSIGIVLLKLCLRLIILDIGRLWLLLNLLLTSSVHWFERFSAWQLFLGLITGGGDPVISLRCAEWILAVLLRELVILTVNIIRRLIHTSTHNIWVVMILLHFINIYIIIIIKFIIIV